MNATRRAEVLKALAANDYPRLREIAGRACILTLIREAQA